MNALICGRAADDRTRASPKAALFITLIVKAPIIQIFAILLGMLILCVELPLPAIKRLPLYRSLIVRPILLLFQFSLTILYYQVRIHLCLGELDHILTMF